MVHALLPRRAASIEGNADVLWCHATLGTNPRRCQWILLVLVLRGRDYISPLEGNDYTWYISGIYFQLGDYILPFTRTWKIHWRCWRFTGEGAKRAGKLELWGHWNHDFTLGNEVLTPDLQTLPTSWVSPLSTLHVSGFPHLPRPRLWSNSSAGRTCGPRGAPRSSRPEPTSDKVWEKTFPKKVMGTKTGVKRVFETKVKVKSRNIGYKCSTYKLVCVCVCVSVCVCVCVCEWLYLYICV